MFTKRKKTIFLLFMLVALLSTSTVLSQYEPETNKSILKNNGSDSDWSKYFVDVPPESYIKINAFGTVSLIIVLFAVLVGFISFLIGWNAGIRNNKRTVLRSVLAAITISIIARPAIIWLHVFLHDLSASIFSGTAETIATAIIGLFIYLLWTAYLVTIPIFLYETFTINIREALTSR
ncbi:MAG: hypothetical protein ACOY90_05240 [Candidatus Zhuqueibacterota bacterium]